MQLYNPSSFPSQVTLVLREPGRAGSDSDPSATFEVSPGEVLIFPRLLPALFGASVGGSLDLRLRTGSLPALRTVVSRPGLGGVVVPALAPVAALAAPAAGVILIPEDAFSRVNVGFRALSEGAAWEASLRDRRGALRARRLGTLPGHGYLHAEATEVLGESPRPGDVLHVSVASGALFVRGHDPALVRLADGKLAAVFAYLTESLRVSTSSDGVKWSEPEMLVLLDEAGLPVPEVHGKVCLVRMPDGRLRMYSNGPQGITSFVPAE